MINELPDPVLMRGGLMTSEEAVQFSTFLGALRARFSNADLDLPTVPDIVETMHVATKEPELNVGKKSDPHA